MDRELSKPRIEELRQRLRAPTAVVGVGNELCGDDAAGVLVAQLLGEAVGPGRVSDRLHVVQTGPVPENYIGPILQDQPHQVVFCDAVDFGGAPGEWRVFEMDDLSEACVSTHNSSLALLSRVLAAEGVEDIFVVGIQPKQTSFGSSCSSEVMAAVEEIVAALLAAATCSEDAGSCLAGDRSHQTAL